MLVDEQPFDLMEHRVVRGVGIVGTIDATERDDAHGRLLLLHHANLDGAGLAAQEQRRFLALLAVELRGRREVEIFEEVARRVRERNVQRFEVVPLVFDLRTFGDGEAEPAHDLLELFDGLRDRMQPAEERPAARFGDIERQRRDVAAAGFESQLGRFERRFDALLGRVKVLAGGRLVGLVDRAETLLDGLEFAVLGAEKIDARRVERRIVGRNGERRFRSRGERFKFSSKFRQGHDS